MGNWGWGLGCEAQERLAGRIIAGGRPAERVWAGGGTKQDSNPKKVKARSHLVKMAGNDP